MFQWISRLTLNQRLALVAFILGAVALGASPTRQGVVAFDPRELALAVQRGTDHVGVGTLADDLVKGHADYRVIDVRAEAAYTAYHIPSAESVPLAALAAADLPRNEKLVLYGEDGVQAAQAWFLLRARGYRGVYMLRGGLAEWRDNVLYPVLSEVASVEARRENDRRTAVAASFGGAPRAAAAPAPGTAPVAAALPAPAPPSVTPSVQLPAGTAKPKAPAKRKEGC
jgi:rhodanese-related sulfurtransferase